MDVDKGPTQRWTTWVAVLVAYVTALQLVFGGLAPVSATPFDPARILCAGSVPNPGGAADHPPAPAHSSDCCLLGCCATAHGPGLAPIADADMVRRIETAAVPAVWPAAPVILRPGYPPRQTRGPPTAG